MTFDACTLSQTEANKSAAIALLRAAEFLTEAAAMTAEGTDESRYRKRADLIEWARAKIEQAEWTRETLQTL